ncbi:4Fe-4S dicluster domain-containing protein [Acidobacteriota bacterium]
MTFLEVLGELAFVSAVSFFLIFAVISLIEKERRASLRSFFIAGLLAVVNIFFFIIPLPFRNWSFASVFALCVGILLYVALPPRPRHPLQILGPSKKVDERDVIFARFDLVEKSPHYVEYYIQNPEYKSVDDEIRKLPDILSPHHVQKHPVHFNLAASEFEFLEQQLQSVDGEVHPSQSAYSPKENTTNIKNMVHYLGADICGVCELDQAFVYSHVGRGPEPYGSEIVQNHTYAVVFAIEMEQEMIDAAPQSPVIIETAKKYVEAAKISIIAAQQIRKMGYAARAHIAGSNCQAMLPPLGWKAGLGELGRFGMLITLKFGARMRLGLLTTDLPLLPDHPIACGIQDFCGICKKCAENCPSQAIPYNGKTEENGVLKWVLNRENCYRTWRRVGTDCAVCISVCPYSKTDNGLHRVIRHFTTWSKRAQSLSLLGDDFFYGRKPKRKPSPF